MFIPLALLACATPAQNSVLLIVTDDIGAEMLSFHPMAGPDPVSTPTLSAFAASGVSFTDFWATPLCSSTRAAILTGRYGHRTGVGTLVNKSEPPGAGLQAAEVTLAERLQARGYPCALFGKWHLTNEPDAACDQGFDAWSGSLRSLGPGDYYDWAKWSDTATTTATESRSQVYATDDTTDDALAWIGAQAQPWFCMVSYNAGHTPFQDPPGYSSSTSMDMYRAMIKYLDGELGRLLGGVDMRSTTVLIVSDNGLIRKLGGGKGNVYRSGIETMLLAGGWAVNRSIAVGHNAAGEEIDGHAHAVDLFSTVLRLMPGNDGGVVWPTVDSEPLFGPFKGWFADRQWNFTEKAVPLGVPAGGPYTGLVRAAEEAGYKAIWDATGAVELYHVTVDPWETVDLLADGVDPWEQSVLDRLSARLGEIGLP